MLVSIVVYAISFLLTRALSRYRELAADRSGAILIGRPSVLASALVKVTGEMGADPDPGPAPGRAVQRLLLHPGPGPGGQRRAGFSLSALFSTHPTLERRLAQLAELEAQLGQPSELSRRPPAARWASRHAPRPDQAGPGQPRRPVRAAVGGGDPADGGRPGRLGQGRGVLEAPGRPAGGGRARRRSASSSTIPDDAMTTSRPRAGARRSRASGRRRRRSRQAHPGRGLLRLPVAAARRPRHRGPGHAGPPGQLDAHRRRLGTPAPVLGLRLHPRRRRRPRRQGRSSSSTCTSGAPSTPSPPTARSTATPSWSCGCGRSSAADLPFEADLARWFPLWDCPVR